MQGLAAAWIAFMTIGCGSTGGDAPIGTLAYLAAGTGNAHVEQLPAGSDVMLDDGVFDAISIAPGARHVAVQRADQTIELIDRATGAIATFPARSTSYGPATWLTPTTLTYEVAVDGVSMSELVDFRGAPIDRPLDVFSWALAPDGATIALVDNQGNLAIENLDGTGRRQLVASPDPTAMYPLAYPAFSPDGATLMVADAHEAVLHLVRVADGSSIADVADIAPSFFAGLETTIVGASPISPDGSEVLMQSRTALVAVTLATGAMRTIVDLPAHTASEGAVWIDADRVLWVRADDHSVGDEGMFLESLHVAGPGATDDVVLDAPSHVNEQWSTIAVSPQGFVAIPSDDATLVAFDGTVLAGAVGAVGAADILGITPDGGGAIALWSDRTVHFVDTHGDDTVLAATGTPADSPIGPFAAYAGAD